MQSHHDRRAKTQRSGAAHSYVAQKNRCVTCTKYPAEMAHVSVLLVIQGLVWGLLICLLSRADPLHRTPNTFAMNAPIDASDSTACTAPLEPFHFPEDMHYVEAFDDQGGATKIMLSDIETQINSVWLPKVQESIEQLCVVKGPKGPHGPRGPKGDPGKRYKGNKGSNCS